MIIWMLLLWMPDQPDKEFQLVPMPPPIEILV